MCKIHSRIFPEINKQSRILASLYGGDKGLEDSYWPKHSIQGPSVILDRYLVDNATLVVGWLV